MKAKAIRLVIIIVFGMVTCLPSAMAQDWANLNKYAEANSKIEAPLETESRVVFMGNSIIEKWSIYDSAFFSGSPYINRGISGQVTAQMLLRFRPDVIELNPEVVVILAGTNDIAENQGPITVDRIAGNIFSMAELARQHGIKVILSSVLPANSYSWNPGIEPAKKIIELNKLIKNYADAHELIYIDYYKEMVNNKEGLKKEFGRDSVHPSTAGYQVMGTLVEKAIVEVLKKD